MAGLFIPTDGRLTSQNVFSGPFDGTELFPIVAPGNAQLGNSYAVTAATLSSYFGAATFSTVITIESGATPDDPYYVTATDLTILFNKTIQSPSYAVCPLAASRATPNGILFKDLKGDADLNPITVIFSSNETCDGLSEVVISTAFGWATLYPKPGGGAWYQGD